MNTGGLGKLILISGFVFSYAALVGLVWLQWGVLAGICAVVLLPPIVVFLIPGTLRLYRAHSKRLGKEQRKIDEKHSKSTAKANGKTKTVWELLQPWVYGAVGIIGIPFLVYLGLEFKGWLENPPFTAREMVEFEWSAIAILIIAFCTIYVLATMTPWKKGVRDALWLLGPIMFGAAVVAMIITNWLDEPTEEQVAVMPQQTALPLATVLAQSEWPSVVIPIGSMSPEIEIYGRTHLRVFPVLDLANPAYRVYCIDSLGNETVVGDTARPCRSGDIRRQRFENLTANVLSISYAYVKD